MERIKAIDIFRGVCMCWMFFGHLLDWWMQSQYSDYVRFIHGILDPVGASGFLFIGGLSITISLRRRLEMSKTAGNQSNAYIRNNYLLRAFFLFLIAITYNTAVAVAINDLTWIWSWFILFTVAISLFLAWPFFKSSIWLRVSIGIMIWIMSYFLYTFLLPFRGQNNIYGWLYHILYNDYGLDPILNFFPFMLFGTVVGDLLYKAYIRQNNKNRRDLRKNFILPLFFVGTLLICFGILFNFPNFFVRSSLSWQFYTLGILITFFIILFGVEHSGRIKMRKSYKFLFYYSYYSFTVFLIHNLLYFVFYGRLTPITIWPAVIITVILFGLFLRQMYKWLGGHFSLKVQIGRLSAYFASKIEKIKRK